MKLKTLTGKIIFHTIVVSISIGIIFSAVNFYQNREYLINSKISEKEVHLNLFAQAIQMRVDELKKDVSFLASTPPISGVMRAYKNGGKDPKDGSSKDLWLSRLEIIFKEMLYSQENYTQIRYIGNFNGGRELLRVDRDGAKVFRVEDRFLQQKENEFYFKEIVESTPGKAYLSGFSLNRERGKITYPLQMVLRGAIPLASDPNEIFGFVIVNVDYTAFFKDLKSLQVEWGDFYVLDEDNKVILNSKSDSKLVTKENSNIKEIFKENQEVLKIIEKHKMSYDAKTHHFKNGIYLTKLIQFDTLNPNRHLYIIANIEKSYLMDQVFSGLVKNFLLVTLLTSLSVFMSLLFARSIAKPIMHLMNLTRKIEAGAKLEYFNEEIKSNDEIAELTKTLINMSKDIVKKNYLMEAQQKALDSSAIVAETDLKGRITYVNEKFIDISQFSEEELIGQDHRIVNSGYHPKEFFTEMWKTISRGSIWKAEVKNKAKDGSYYWVDTTVYPVKDENGKMFKYVAIRFDITERKRIEEELKLASESAIRSMNFRTEFLANMSHEIRTPLNNIIGLADVLHDMPLDENSKKYVNSLRSSGDSLLNLINDILDLSKIDSGQLELEAQVFDLEELMEQVADAMAVNAHGKGVELNLFFGNQVPVEVVGDSLRTRQIVTNLLSNAVKFTEKGKVDLILKTEKQSNNLAFVSIEVIDTGMGIKEENIENIFKSYGQADAHISKKFGGTGLGLNIVKELVELMNGNLELQSEFGKGSSFKCVLPMKIAKTTKSKMEQFSSLFANKKVMLVEESEANINILSEYFNTWNINLEISRNRKELLEKCENSNFELIIFNHMIESSKATELALEVQQKFNLDRFLFMYTTDLRKQNFDDLKAFDNVGYLFKPIKRNDLAEEISKIFSLERLGKILISTRTEKEFNELQRKLSSLNLEIYHANSLDISKKLIVEHNIDSVLCNFSFTDNSAISFIEDLRNDNINTYVTFISDVVREDIMLKMKRYSNTQLLFPPLDEIIFNETIKASVLVGHNFNVQESVLKLSSIEGLRILIAEDTKVNRQLLQIYLKDEGHELVFVENGDEAVAAFKKTKFDIVLMDMQMPVMDGYDATKLIRKWEMEKSLKNVPIIALTANAFAEDKQKAFQLGCTDYLTKPIKKDVLLNSLLKYSLDLAS